MSDAARNRGETPRGLTLLPRAMTSDELDNAPVLESVDALLIDDLSDDEDDAFAAALES
mgnify:CR=1 FL=1